MRIIFGEEKKDSQKSVVKPDKKKIYEYKSPKRNNYHIYSYIHESSCHKQIKSTKNNLISKFG